MSSLVQVLSKCSFLCVLLFVPVLAQEQTAKPTANPDPPSEKAVAPKTEQEPALPFQIQLLETHIRFEANGDSRKEVHTIVKINDLAGARQFSRLGFDYNRAFQQVEIPVVKIIHANGGTSEILPSAITDAPNPAVQDFPAYHDVRVKSVRILGLQDGDTIEYRVITTTTKHPLAPNFWVEHTFDRSGQVLEEDYNIDVPGEIYPATLMGSSRAGGVPLVYMDVPWSSHRTTKDREKVRSFLEWKLTSAQVATQLDNNGVPRPDILVTTFPSWEVLANALASRLPPWSQEDLKMADLQLRSLKPAPVSAMEKLHASYALLSQHVLTVDLPLDATGFRVRSGKEILETGYATPEEKCYLLSQLAKVAGLSAEVVLYGGLKKELEYARPAFQEAFVLVRYDRKVTALDPSADVAPFGLVRAELRGKRVMSLSWHDAGDYSYYWTASPEGLPFRARQRVNISAEISEDGTLTAKVNYVMRGDNELVLRLAFHQTPKERWKEVAGLLALSDGFRGTITNVTASDPMATKDPFTVEYEITQAKFVDWSKKPVRIPALLPQIALPDAPGKTAGKIELGTPLDVQTNLTLKLPEGTTVETPAATSVARDYATFASKYDGHLNTISVSRHINFLKREIPAERAADYNAFLRAVQNDQAQILVLSPPETQRENRK